MKWNDFTLDVVEPVIHVRCKQCPYGPMQDEIHHLRQKAGSMLMNGERVWQYEGQCPNCGNWLVVQDSAPADDVGPDA